MISVAGTIPKVVGVLDILEVQVDSGSLKVVSGSYVATFPKLVFKPHIHVMEVKIATCIKAELRVYSLVKKLCAQQILCAPANISVWFLNFIKII